MLTLLLIGLAIAATYFAVVWAISVRIKNYGLLDVAWSYGVAVLAPIYALAGPGEGSRKWIAAGIGAAWSLRLGTHILVRVLKHHPTEDVRYETLRKRWPGPGMFLLFFELQAAIAVVFSLPFLFAAFNPNPTLAPIEIAGLAVALFSLCGEALADRQVSAFKADAANQGKICQEGLWHYSRHPNYFFEALAWVGFALFALGSPDGAWAVTCPLLMLYLLLKVTGIPLTEEHSVRSKGDAYREYQRTTSAFIPWFRKTS
jgi:steroid 5-alpha reductase family enzyme